MMDRQPMGIARGQGISIKNPTIKVSTVNIQNYQLCFLII